jgi:hypothetical protein
MAAGIVTADFSLIGTALEKPHRGAVFFTSAFSSTFLFPSASLLRRRLCRRIREKTCSKRATSSP